MLIMIFPVCLLPLLKRKLRKPISLLPCCLVMDMKNVTPDLEKILSSGSIGTSFMTLFSHLVAESEQEQFREPELLGQLIQNLHDDIKKEYARPAGWILHYLVGYMFVMIYEQVWKHTSAKPGLASGLVLGGISGVLAVFVWKKVFDLHPDPPQIDFKKYYTQLFLRTWYLV